MVSMNRKCDQPVTSRFLRALLAGVFASIATGVSAQSTTANLTVGVTVVRSCSVNREALTSPDGRDGLKCGKGPAVQISNVSWEAPLPMTVIQPQMQRLAPSIECPGCRVLVLNF